MKLIKNIIRPVLRLFARDYKALKVDPMSSLIHHPIEPDCKISKFEDWENDVWDKINSSKSNAFYTKVDKVFERYELP